MQQDDMPLDLMHYCISFPLGAPARRGGGGAEIGLLSWPWTCAAPGRGGGGCGETACSNIFLSSIGCCHDHAQHLVGVEVDVKLHTASTFAYFIDCFHGPTHYLVR